jgi:hypothetical protein
MPIPKPDIAGIQKFLNYRKIGLTYKEIALIMGKEERTLSRWQKYVTDKKIPDEVLDADK